MTSNSLAARFVTAPGQLTRSEVAAFVSAQNLGRRFAAITRRTSGDGELEITSLERVQGQPIIQGAAVVRASAKNSGTALGVSATPSMPGFSAESSIAFLRVSHPREATSAMQEEPIDISWWTREAWRTSFDEDAGGIATWTDFTALRRSMTGRITIPEGSFWEGYVLLIEPCYNELGVVGGSIVSAAYTDAPYDAGVDGPRVGTTPHTPGLEVTLGAVWNDTSGTLDASVAEGLTVELITPASTRYADALRALASL